MPNLGGDELVVRFSASWFLTALFPKEQVTSTFCNGALGTKAPETTATAADDEGDEFDAEKAATDANIRFPKTWEAWQLLSKSIDWRIAEGTKDRPMPAETQPSESSFRKVPHRSTRCALCDSDRTTPITLRSIRMYDPTN